MKELLKAIEGKKEEAIQSYYEYLMQCDREGKKVDYFQLGVLHGSIGGFKESINMIQERLKELKNSESKTQSEMEEMENYIFFLETLVLEMLGISDIIVVGVDSDDESSRTNAQIKPGDDVKVTNKKYTYDKACFSWKILKGYEAICLWGEKPVEGSLYKVLRIELVKYMLKTHGVALIQNPDTKQVYIIDIRGIEKV